MTNFTNIFGGSPVQPSEVAYAQYTLTANLSLNWPTSFIDTDNVVARIMNIGATSNTFSIIMPSAENVSVGADFLVMNTGSNTFNVNTNGNTSIVAVAPGQAWYIWLTDNTTVNGTWSAVLFGAGTSSIVASAIAGNGLIALGNLLNTNFPNKVITTNYTAGVPDRAFLLINTGGTISVTLPSVVMATQGYYLAVNNQGSGQVTIQTPDSATIDGMTTFVMNPGTSSFFICTSPGTAGWNSLGFGQSSSSSGGITALSINIAAGGTTTLTTQQAAYTILTFTGGLAQNATVVFPARVGQWYINNLTTNPLSLTVQLGSGGPTLIIPQGGSFDLYSDGVAWYIIPQAAAGAIVTSITGTANQITASAPTGAVTLSLPNTVAITTSVAAGNMKLIGNTVESTNSNGNVLLAPNGTGALQIINSTNAIPLQFYNSAGTQYVALQAGTLSASTTWTLPTTDSTGTQALVSNGSGALSWASSIPASGGLQSFTVLTSGSAQTYTTPAGITRLYVQVIGGGGGGGGSTGASNSASCGSGGGSGGYAALWITSASATYLYTVGSGGAGGLAGNHIGTGGNTTTFGASLQATGGSGGFGMTSITNPAIGFAVGAPAGVGSSGTINAGGNPGAYSTVTGGGGQPGNGGGGYFGGAGVHTSAGQGAGGAGTGYGSGGSGAASLATSFAGGAGFAGVIIISEFS